MDAFYDAVATGTELEKTNAREVLVAKGYQICDYVGQPGYTRAALIGILERSSWGAVDNIATIMVDAAKTHLCPHKDYTASAYTTPPTADAGPHFGIYEDGVYEVGVDVVAGKWKTEGSEGCYWARLKPETREIIDNNITDGQEIVWLKEGELFETTRCGSWAVAR